MDKLLEIKNLKLSFKSAQTEQPVLFGVNLSLWPNEVLSLVGESASGKSVTALSITKILPPEASIIEGEVIFKGKDLLKCNEEELRQIRGKEISYIFQEATASLNPVSNIGSQIREAIMLHQDKTFKDALHIVKELLCMVRFKDPENIMKNFPHQLSGGMNQRVMIAMALASRAKILIADEPTSALDITTELEIVNMILELKERFGFSILFITHNLLLAKRVSGRIAIMYKGKIVEEGKTDSIFSNPVHQHTKDLVGSLL